MSENFHIGQHVVCVDDFFAPEIARLLDAMPVEGVVYVIRAIHEGVSFDDGRPEKVTTLLLVGLVNPAPAKPGAKERGFNSKRFRPLDELKSKAKKEDLTPYCLRMPSNGELVALPPWALW
jgi:hypothetical protein